MRPFLRRHGLSWDYLVSRRRAAMRNLPQSLVSNFGDTYQTDGRVSDDSYETICPNQWPMAGEHSTSPCLLRSGMPPGAGPRAAPRRPTSKGTHLCAYLVKHRARLLLSFVSLAFLAIFLFVIYRQFGLIVFVSTLSLIVVPGLVALIYARRLKAKEQEQARQRVLNRGQSQRASTRPHKTVQIFATDLEMAKPSRPAEDQNQPEPRPKLKRKATTQKITINLPSSDSPFLTTDLQESGQIKDRLTQSPC